MADLSDRDRSRQREEAGTLLAALLLTVRGFNPPRTARHFKVDFLRLHKGQTEAWGLRDPSELALLRRDAPEEYRDLLSCIAANESFFRILLATVNGKPQQGADLNRLSRALNRKVKRIGFHPNRVAPTGMGPYMPTELDAIRAGAELLLRYLNLTHNCGPVHSVCSVCNGLMTKGRGGKKFCSPECKAQIWRYGSRPDYYKGKGRDRTRMKKLQKAARTRSKNSHTN